MGQFQFPQYRFGNAIREIMVGMTIARGKRPRDPNQLAKWIVEQSTAEQVPQAPAGQEPFNLSAYMAAMGRKGGMVGGKRRLVTMTAAQRKKVAAKAAQARWGKKKAE
ncbi:MAG TPA: hypothetical protein VG225_11250 [Terracidiphilus sp.]|nr:hypothetical protein [Terracidiphilus sp.]